MWASQQKTQQIEHLTDQISQNELIQSWHHDQTGELAWLVVDGSARSADEEERMWRNIGWSLIFSIILALAGNAQLHHAGIDAGGLFFIGCLFIAWPLWVWHILRSSTGERIISISTESVFIDRNRKQTEYRLDQVVGVTLSAVDQQKLDDEQWKKLKNRKPNRNDRPKLLQPYSRKIDLQTDIGTVSLGAIYGIEKAQEIANAINSALAYMKGRSGTGRQPAIDARFQYGKQQAGRIPD